MTDQQPMTAEQQQAHAVLNETARRVHTVLCNYAEVLSRGNKGVVSANESQAIINGAMSGIAVLVARMAIQRDPDGDPDDKRSVEEFYGDMLREQFIATYRLTQAQDAQFDIKRGAPVN